MIANGAAGLAVLRDFRSCTCQTQQAVQSHGDTETGAQGLRHTLPLSCPAAPGPGTTRAGTCAEQGKGLQPFRSNCREAPQAPLRSI